VFFWYLIGAISRRKNGLSESPLQKFLIQKPIFAKKASKYCNQDMYRTKTIALGTLHFQYSIFIGLSKKYRTEPNYWTAYF
jgi:hypothetical protein